MWTTWIYALEAIAIVTANAITIVTFTRTPRLRRRKYCLVVNLAVADFFVGLVAVPLYICTLENQSLTLRKTMRILAPFHAMASLSGLAALAIERVYATYYPFKHRTLSKTPYIVGIPVAWLSALLLTLTLKFWGTNRIAREMLILTGLAIPLVIALCAYSLIWVKVSCMRTVLGHEIHQSNKKLTVTLAIATTVSLIAWVPFIVLSTFNRFCISSCLMPSALYPVTHVFKALHYVNSLVNFIVYSLRMPDFRTEIAQMFRIKACCDLCPNSVNNQNIELEHRPAGRNINNVNEATIHSSGIHCFPT